MVVFVSDSIMLLVCGVIDCGGTIISPVATCAKVSSSNLPKLANPFICDSMCGILF